ncbi:MAG: 3-phosphoshikimate 1-carboxyvinyltransferase [Saprospiraceae bacterium]|nr:3-phosphoshikimate 1-carboxyvinyltransferase [Saprospiraceae bacterium]
MFVTKLKSLSLHHPTGHVSGRVKLDYSKSISNRVLIIRSLCKQPIALNFASQSDDTKSLAQLLRSSEFILNVGQAGTTFRFLTALLAVSNQRHLLTGSERIRQRPISDLVDALRAIGANITYTEKEGFAPILIEQYKYNLNNEVSIAANVSSQFISALLMIAPTLPNGLKIRLEGNVVSRPYIDMTLKIMQNFGVSHIWQEPDYIIISPQSYVHTDFDIEADWSAAAYYFSIASSSQSADITLEGLFENSIQPDATICEIAKSFGIETHFSNNTIRIIKNINAPISSVFEWDFTNCPDIAQTCAVMCACKGIKGLLSGLSTLKVKETDRIKALQNELLKIGCHLSLLPQRFSKNNKREFYLIDGDLNIENTLSAPYFITYGDHRMAMSFAPIGLLTPIVIDDPDVVSKSYPNFWKDLETLGFNIIVNEKLV